MLKHVEKASAYYIGSDVKIEYDDGSWSFAEKEINGLEVTLKPKPKFRGFRRHRLEMINISAHFTLILTIRGYAEIVSDKSLRDVIFPFDNNATSLNEQMKRKEDELLKELITDKAKNLPMRFTFGGFTNNHEEVYWLFNGKFYKDTDDLSVDEVKALLLTRQRMRKERINRAKTIANTPETPVEEQRRGFIPEDVRLLVWERDGGKCTKCGRRNELQFDHIIPFSMGGSSAPENLQILCGPCNRAKSNSIS